MRRTSRVLAYVQYTESNYNINASRNGARVENSGCACRKYITQTPKMNEFVVRYNQKSGKRMDSTLIRCGGIFLCVIVDAYLYNNYVKPLAYISFSIDIISVGP